jgi:hypothetical protein
MVLRQIEVIDVARQDGAGSVPGGRHFAAASRRVSEPADLLQPEGSANCHRATAQSIQHDPPTLIARIAANIHRPAAKPRSACTYPVVSIRLVRNTRQVTRVLVLLVHLHLVA